MNQYFFLGPNAIIHNFYDPEIQTAAQMSRGMAIELGEVPPAYSEDPIIVTPDAYIAKNEFDRDDLFFGDTNFVPEYLLWEGGDGKTYVVHIKDCYRATDMVCMGLLN
jgi:hypothetical protein